MTRSESRRRFSGHYEALGLLAPAGRSGAGYRLYDRRAITRLLRIKWLKSLGLSLGEIGARLKEAEDCSGPIPKRLREKLGLDPAAEVEFSVERGELVLRKKTTRPRPGLDRWTGFLNGQPEDVDEFIEDIRGR